MALLALAALSLAQVANFGGDARHTSVYDNASVQDLNVLRWSTTIDYSGPGDGEVYAHYGSPLITAANTVIVPIYANNNGNMQIQITGFAGASAVGPNPAPLYGVFSDYVFPPNEALPGSDNYWGAAYQPVLAQSPAGLRVCYAGANGNICVFTQLDGSSPSAPVTITPDFTVQADETVYVDTPLTSDPQGNVFFGFRTYNGVVDGNNVPIPVRGGIGRIDHATNAYTHVFVSDLNLSAIDGNSMTLDVSGCAPAYNSDLEALYLAVRNANHRGYLVRLNPGTLSLQGSAELFDPRVNPMHAQFAPALLLDQSTASPLIAPDGDVFMGVMASRQSPLGNNSERGFLLHFTKDLAFGGFPGGFGWDFTPALIDLTRMHVSGYAGASKYLILCKEQNYSPIETLGDGDGVNRIAVLDPNAAQVDPHPSAVGLTEMREVITLMGFTPDPENMHPVFAPNAVREWCINAPAINPQTNSAYFPSEDGNLYCWRLDTNTISRAFVLPKSAAEAYVPTVIGPDGTVYTINARTLCAVGKAVPHTGQTPVSIKLSFDLPGLTAAAVESTKTLKVTATLTDPNNSLNVPKGTVTFMDQELKNIAILESDSSGDKSVVPRPNDTSAYNSNNYAVREDAATVPLSASGTASYTINTSQALNPYKYAWAGGVHFVTAQFTPAANDTHASIGAMIVQRVHTSATQTSLTYSGSSGSYVLTAKVKPSRQYASIQPQSTGLLVNPTGMVSFFDEHNNVLAQVAVQPDLTDLNSSVASATCTLASGTHTITASYASDPNYAASAPGTPTTIVVPGSGGGGGGGGGGGNNPPNCQVTATLINGKLVWLLPPCAVSYDGPILYDVFRSPRRDGPFQLIGSVKNGLTFEDQSRKRGETYWYRVIARDAFKYLTTSSEALKVTYKDR